MASHLDTSEQEQLDQLKAFWKRYGTLVVWVLVLALGGFAAWNYWQNSQVEKSHKAGQLYQELLSASQAGDIKKADQIFGDIKAGYPRAVYSHHAALLVAKLHADKAELDAAALALTWVADNAVEPEHRTIAKFRLAGVLFDQKKFDEALKQLDGADLKEYAGLVADRRGDILAAQGKAAEAVTAYQAALVALPQGELRNMVESKLIVRGALPEPAAPKAAP
jgi:predicted negative regulator of RcsB-dependent stress response